MWKIFREEHIILDSHVGCVSALGPGCLDLFHWLCDSYENGLPILNWSLVFFFVLKNIVGFRSCWRGVQSSVLCPQCWRLDSLWWLHFVGNCCGCFRGVMKLLGGGKRKLTYLTHPSVVALALKEGRIRDWTDSLKQKKISSFFFSGLGSASFLVLLYGTWWTHIKAVVFLCPILSVTCPSSPFLLQWFYPVIPIFPSPSVYWCLRFMSISDCDNQIFLPTCMSQIIKKCLCSYFL